MKILLVWLLILGSISTSYADVKLAANRDDRAQITVDGDSQEECEQALKETTQKLKEKGTIILNVIDSCKRGSRAWISIFKY